MNETNPALKFFGNTTTTLSSIGDISISGHVKLEDSLPVWLAYAGDLERYENLDISGPATIKQDEFRPIIVRMYYASSKDYAGFVFLCKGNINQWARDGYFFCMPSTDALGRIELTDDSFNAVKAKSIAGVAVLFYTGHVDDISLDIEPYLLKQAKNAGYSFYNFKKIN